jgi:hypothetical protein
MNYHDSQRLNTKTTTPRLLQIVAGIGRAKSCGIGTENNGDQPPIPINSPRFAAHDLPDELQRLLQTVAGLGRGESREIGTLLTDGKPTPATRKHHDSTRLTLPTIFNNNYTPSPD